MKWYHKNMITLFSIIENWIWAKHYSVKLLQKIYDFKKSSIAFFRRSANILHKITIKKVHLTIGSNEFFHLYDSACIDAGPR